MVSTLPVSKQNHCRDVVIFFFSRLKPVCAVYVCAEQVGFATSVMYVYVCVLVVAPYVIEF